MIDYKYYQETIFGKYEEFKIIMTLGDYCSLAEFKFKNHNILIILMLDKLQLLIGINIDKYVSAGISIPLNNKLPTIDILEQLQNTIEINLKTQTEKLEQSNGI